MIILGTNSIKDTGFDVANSLRFNDDSTDYLSRTPSGDGNRKTWTFSTWIKRGNIGIGNPINVFGGEDGGSRYSDIMIGTPIGADDTFWFKQDTGTVAELRSTMKLRDIAAWYNLVFTYDSTDSTAADRMKMYVNGVRLTDFVTNTNAGSNVDSYVNTSGDPNYIGIYQASSKKLDAYLCETVLIDGTALAADSFGEFDSDSGIWKPIDVSGLTFGTNGFYMEYKESGTGTNASGMGADTSGNTNHFAVNNITAVDQSTDTCTNNFATLNPVVRSNNITFAEGNLKITGDGSANFSGSHGTIAVNNGKWYCEVKVTNAENLQIGALIINSSSSGDATGTGSGGMYYYYENIYWQDNNTAIKVANSPESGANASVTGGSNSVNTYSTDIISMALDMDNGRIYFAKNGTYENSGNPANGTNAFVLQTNYNDGNGMTFYASLHSAAVEMNFGSPSFSISSGNADGNGYGNFEYAVPSGYYSLCTKNLAEFG